jgi:hypothetical protein
MHVPINFKSPDNTSKWQMRFNSAFKGLILLRTLLFPEDKTDDDDNTGDGKKDAIDEEKEG